MHMMFYSSARTSVYLPIYSDNSDKLLSQLESKTTENCGFASNSHIVTTHVIYNVSTSSEIISFFIPKMCHFTHTMNDPLPLRKWLSFLK